MVRVATRIKELARGRRPLALLGLAFAGAAGQVVLFSTAYENATGGDPAPTVAGLLGITGLAVTLSVVLIVAHLVRCEWLPRWPIVFGFLLSVPLGVIVGAVFPNGPWTDLWSYRIVARYYGVLVSALLVGFAVVLRPLGRDAWRPCMALPAVLYAGFHGPVFFALLIKLDSLARTSSLVLG